jgi:hypothetical protein
MKEWRFEGLGKGRRNYSDVIGRWEDARREAGCPHELTMGEKRGQK